MTSLNEWGNCLSGGKRRERERDREMTIEFCCVFEAEYLCILGCLLCKNVDLYVHVEKLTNIQQIYFAGHQ